MNKLILLKGSSMHPYLKNGDLIAIEPMDNLQPDYGDLVVVKNPSNGQLLAHRYLGESKIKGDRNLSIDQKLHPELEIVGRATSRFHRFHTINLPDSPIKTLQGKLCEMNHANQFFLLRKCCVLGLLTIGWSLRQYEKFFAKRAYYHG